MCFDLRKINSTNNKKPNKKNPHDAHAPTYLYFPSASVLGINVGRPLVPGQVVEVGPRTSLTAAPPSSCCLCGHDQHCLPTLLRPRLLSGKRFTQLRWLVTFRLPFVVVVVAVRVVGSLLQRATEFFYLLPVKPKRIWLLVVLSWQLKKRCW